MKTKTHRKPRIRIDFHNNAKDLAVLVMAQYGMHTKAIARRLHLGASQVQLRIKRGNLIGVRKSWRDGISTTFIDVYNVTHKAVQYLEKKRLGIK